MSPAVRRLAIAALLIAGLRQPLAADPLTPDTNYDPAAAPTPWIDQGASPVALTSDPAREDAQPADHRLAAALTLGGLYAGFTTWTYFAWYRKHKPLEEFRWGGDGWFGLKTYAGGADKFGHAWATMSLARLGTEMLHQW